MGQAEDATKPVPADSLTISNVNRSASRGPGSGNDDWVRFADTVAESTATLFATCEA